MQTCLQLQWLLAGECAARHTYISKYATAIHQNVALPRCHSICGKQRAAEYTQKLRHLNPAARQNPAVNPLTTNALQDFQ